MKTRILLLAAMCFAGTVVAQPIEGTSNSVAIDLTKPTPVIAKTANPDKITLETLGLTTLPKYHALIIGVSQYKYAGAGLPNLEMPEKDAEKIYSILTEHYAFEPENVTLLKNATREEIINTFDRLASTVKEKDNLLVFYAGHGFYDKSKDFGYWLPADAKKTSTAAWIANSTIKDYMGAINSKHTLLITDACFGGSIFKTRSVEAAIMQFNQLYKNNSRKALTSGNLTEVPDQSVFVRYFIKKLEENEDVFLSTGKLFSRMYEPIINNTPTVPQYGVIQGAGDEGGDFIFIKKN